MESIQSIFWSLVFKVKFSKYTLNPFKVQKSANKESSPVMINREEGIDGDALPIGLKRELMPRHVAVIMDGNRRWARQKGLNPIEGYLAGIEVIRALITSCSKWGIPIVSLFFFSSENWQRPKKEIYFLVHAFEKSLKEEQSLLMSSGARVSVIGDLELFPTSLQETIKHVEETTKNNTKLHMILAMSYSGQNDITHACRKIAAKAKDGVLKPEDITKSVIEQELQTNITDIPCPDLLIRTSGELRISNYYLWQLAYSEMYFTNAFWPDFDEQEFVKALDSFQKRGRRFGMN